jgi:hypothetical protein
LHQVVTVEEDDFVAMDRRSFQRYLYLDVR